MRGLTHRWIPPDLNDPGGSPESGVATATVGAARLEPLVARVLLARGKRTYEEIAAFCHPRLTDLHDPALLPDIDKAAQRLLSALSAGEPIVIYGDYDVDGMTATAILFHTMRAIAPGAPVSTYVPHRLDEGYGLHSEAIEQLAREGARVVVSVDCGVTAFEPATVARRLGLDLIITDHHNLAGEGAASTQGDEQLPDAFAVVHPRRKCSAYPFPDLCGAAVAFKLAWRMATTAAGGRVGDAMRSTLLDMLALAALGTIADIVPLVGENRLIARHGLARLRSTGLQGLATLIEVSGLAGENIDAEHVGFWLGPRLNACGRMGHAREAVELLTTAPPDEARRIATKLTALNEDRQKTERAITPAWSASSAPSLSGATTDPRS
jgi:single-stranded-DNA-specific exonuclease